MWRECTQLKNEFFFEIFAVSVFPWYKDSPQIVIYFFKPFTVRPFAYNSLVSPSFGEQLVWTHLCCFVLCLVGVRGSGPPVSSLFRLCRFSCIVCRLCNRSMTFVEMQNSAILHLHKCHLLHNLHNGYTLSTRN